MSYVENNVRIAEERNITVRRSRRLNKSKEEHMQKKET